MRLKTPLKLSIGNMLVIRLFRTGKKNQPTFKIVVTDKRKSSTRGRFVEQVGFWNPLTKEKSLKQERIKYWLSVGVKPSATIHNLLISEKIIEGKKIDVHKKAKVKEGKPAEPSVAKATEGKEATPAPAGATASRGEKPTEPTVPAPEVKPAPEKKEKKTPKEGEPLKEDKPKEVPSAPEKPAEVPPAEKKEKEKPAESNPSAEKPKTE